MTGAAKHLQPTREQCAIRPGLEAIREADVRGFAATERPAQPLERDVEVPQKMEEDLRFIVSNSFLLILVRHLFLLAWHLLLLVRHLLLLARRLTKW